MVRIDVGITKEHLEEVYSHPSMQKLAHDHRTLEPIDHPLVKYYSAFSNHTFMGAFIVVSNSKIDKELHILLLPKSVFVIRDLFAKIIDEIMMDSVRVTGIVIDGLNTIKNLVEKFGFKLEGIKRSACQQNGVLKDLYMYGLLKSEWEDRK